MSPCVYKIISKLTSVGCKNKEKFRKTEKEVNLSENKSGHKLLYFPQRQIWFRTQGTSGKQIALDRGQTNRLSLTNDLDLNT